MTSHAEKLKKFDVCRVSCKTLASGKICACLEAVLPRDQNQSVGAFFGMNMEAFPTTEQDKKRPKRFKKTLKRFGLDKFRIKCLMLKFVFNYSYQQIADELHCPNKATPFYAVRTALQMLRERGASEKDFRD